MLQKVPGGHASLSGAWIPRPPSGFPIRASQTSKPTLELQSQDCRHLYPQGTCAQILGQCLDVDSTERSPVLSCTVAITK